MVSSETFKIYGWLTATIIFSGLWAMPALSKPQNPADLCISAVAKQEVAKRIPRHLLRAISIAESGRWIGSRKANLAWPWTVTSGGKGTHYKSKSTAIQAVRTLQRRGIQNIDIGCMQVNLRYHPKAFKSLEHAFDPHTNAAYAANFLQKLRKLKGSWSQAVKHYHSATQTLNGPYHAKVHKIWRGERRKAQNIRVAKHHLQQRRARARYDNKRTKHKLDGNRLKRQRVQAPNINKRAERLLADNRFAARSQRWLDRASKRLFKQ